ncbi:MULTISPECIES: hypothetical protein [unclassified Paenibacillus]|uniref:hypothetical protein n=1 Tax=unclassified Paenibacillus TaxID=185978 RepID=UPI001AE32F60|nr:MULTISPECIES: hypothetical protein [unclassified Paenibacillus]MBP1155678.1 hypothetical protein [Paenibacillus sp. PvP091]MBP1168936.1 hypothetical protein [Paenibacillus sp. PvR098]MBP2439964.1 hypothetical protein [Paenibacillus sp. PvP052]
MKRTAILMIAGCLLFILSAFSFDAQPNLNKLRLTHTKVASPDKLIRAADLIVFGRFDNRTVSYPTGVPLGSGQLVNYVQPLHVHQTIKGSTGQSPIRVLTDGVEPLPKPSDPLNLTYTGPVAQGEYVSFLRKLPGTDMYILMGQWQGIYPVVGGKLIALHEGGFQQFMGLTIPEVIQLVHDTGTYRTQENQRDPSR